MPILRRYTKLGPLIYMLLNKKITLLNPATWDDKNDAYFMAEYKRKKDLNTVLAICFAECGEKYHHWRVFAHGEDGVCVEFRKEDIVKIFKSKVKCGVTARTVAYERIETINNTKELAVDDLPFLKRIPYQDEKEYRVVFASKTEFMQDKDYDFKLSSIRRITISPWMPKNVSKSVKRFIRKIEGCSKLQIARSTLIENEIWKRAASRATSKEK